MLRILIGAGFEGPLCVEKVPGVEDVDAVMAGHDFLAAAGYDHHAGIGRHVLGSQIFDYWRDPWGHVVEHFTDGDLFNDQTESTLHDPGTALGTLWGSFVSN